MFPESFSPMSIAEPTIVGIKQNTIGIIRSFYLRGQRSIRFRTTG